MFGTEEVESQPISEVVTSPVGKPKARGGKNKDGFVAGQLLNEKEYATAIAKARKAEADKIKNGK